MKTETYFKNLKEEVDKIYNLSNLARAKGYDPVDEVEIPLAISMAEKVVGLISTIYPQMMNSGIAPRILELEKQYGKLDPTVVFKIAEEVSDQKFCTFNSILESIDAGIRVGFAYITLGVVSSPIEGYTGLEKGKTREGQDYLIANFSGPIRSAGTTASCIVLMLIDFLRERFGFAKYDPTEEEIRRVYTELADFHERITNLQYMPTEEEAVFLARYLPFQVSGEPSEKLEVSNYKNLTRVSTNYLRSGFCLVLAEGLAQKAAKGFRLYNMARKNGITMTGFDFLEEYNKIHEKRTLGKDKAKGPPTYIKDLVAGRPVFGHPARSGGFRFRYGRGRNSGFSAVCLHPATMGITDDFLAIGTQLKVEKPTKGCAVTVCDKIEGPIVKLSSGSVKKIQTREEAKKIYPFVEEIIYLGDILFPFSDLLNRNAQLITPGYVEEWWHLELKEKDLEFANSIDAFNVSFEEAREISKKYSLPLHPSYIYYWKEISKEGFFNLLSWLNKGIYDLKLILPYTKKDKEEFAEGKRALELMGVPHEVTTENIVFSSLESKSFLFNLGIDVKLKEEIFSLENLIKISPDFLEKEILEIVNALCEFKIKDKSGEFIGSRMGRPEKAKLRKLIGSPNVLFSVGNQGGRLRSIQAAYGLGKISSQFPLYFCPSCRRESIYRRCEVCDNKTERRYYFYDIKEKTAFEKFEGSEKKGTPYMYRDLDIVELYERCREKLKMTKDEMPSLIKGVRGVNSDEKSLEHLCKGMLRAKYDLQVNKDGTIRMDATELPLVAFKPREIGTSVEKLNSLGYDLDVYGKPLVNDEQIVELMPHDVLIPSAPETPDERGEDVFFKICNFMDDLLEKFYGLEKFYNVKTKEDLIGQLGVCMAPHNCAGVVCRFIGFSKTLGLMASPYMHAAIRRDCDGDEAAIMLLGDVLLNFSRKYLPSHRGGTQDAPLVLNAKIDAGEVDDQILDFEFLFEYPLELYRKAEQKLHSSEVSVYTVKKILREGKDPFHGAGFTHDTTNFNNGVVCSAYKLLGAMQEKVNHQMALVERIRAVDTSDTARLIIERHFIRDMRGNLRNFSVQNFRCVACNEITRRVPLAGVCPFCGGKLIFTIHEGGIKKYLEPALELSKKYNLSPYLQQTLELVKGYIDSIFGKEKEKQESIDKWF